MRLAEAYRLIAELTAQAGRLSAEVERLSARVEELERQARKDSSTSSRPPSSDSPYRKKAGTGRCGNAGNGGRESSPACRVDDEPVDDPDETSAVPRPRAVGAARTWPAPVTAQRRHQVTEIEPAPAPKVIEYVAQAKQCPGAGRSASASCLHACRARASYGPEACAQAANLAVGHHIPIYRAALLLCQLAGIAVSTGWMAGIRGKAAALVEASGFMDRVRELLRAAPALHADETPARAAGGTRYVHLACTRYLTACTPVTGQRRPSTPAGPARLPGYHRPRRLRRVRASHRCAARLVRGSLAARPQGAVPLRARRGRTGRARMADLLIEARDAAAAARAAGQSALNAGILEDLVTRYRALAAAGLAANLYRRTATARDARRIAAGSSASRICPALRHPP